MDADIAGGREAGEADKQEPPGGQEAGEADIARLGDAEVPFPRSEISSSGATFCAA